MIESILASLFVAALGSIGALFLKWVEKKNEAQKLNDRITELQATINQLQLENAEFKKTVAALQAENAELKTPKHKTHAESVRIRRPERMKNL